MGGGAIRAGRAFVELFVDDSKMQGTLKRTSANMRKWGAAIGAIGAGITGVFLKAADSFAKAGDRLDKMSKRTGVSVEALSALDFAASQSGTSLEAVEKAVRGMSRNLVDAERGLSTATDNFSDLGIALKDLQGLSPEEQFLLIAERISGIEDPTRRAGVAMKVFGKAGTELLPLLANGKDGIRELMEEAERLGIVLSTEDAVAAAKLTDELDKMKRQFGQIAVEIGGAVAPMLSNLAPQLGNVAKGVAEWAAANPGLFQTLLKIGAVLAVGGPIIAGLGTLLGLLTGPLGIVAAVAAVGALTFSIVGVEDTINDLKFVVDLLKQIKDAVPTGSGGGGSGGSGGAGGLFSPQALANAGPIGQALLAAQTLKELRGGGAGPTSQAPPIPVQQFPQQDESGQQPGAGGGKGSGQFGLDMGILPGRSPADQFEIERKKDKLAKERIEQELDAAERAKEERDRAAEERKRADEERQQAMDRFRDQAMSAIDSGKQQLQGRMQGGIFSADIRARHFDQRQQVELEIRDLNQEQLSVLETVAQRLELV
jgi:TP901 family phage tail tape measure protein